MSDPSAAAAHAGYQNPSSYGGFQALPPYGGYTAPPREPQPRPYREDTNGLAIAALVCSLVGLVCGGSLLGLIFGIIALVQIKRTGQRGRGMAISGVIIGGLQVIAIAAIITVGIVTAVTEEDLRNDAGEVANEGELGLAALAPGDCVNGLSDEEEMIYELPVVPCAQPHQGEVFATFDLPKGDWPGQEAAYQQASEGCLERFPEYSSEAFDDPSVGMHYISPTRSSWRLGDREAICIAYFLDGERTGSVRD